MLPDAELGPWLTRKSREPERHHPKPPIEDEPGADFTSLGGKHFAQFLRKNHRRSRITVRNPHPNYSRCFESIQRQASILHANTAYRMETAELLSLVEQLEDNIDDLEENLEPLLAAALSATTKKLPVLDKAKLYVLIVYSIESLLFCSCPVFKVQPQRD